MVELRLVRETATCSRSPRGSFALPERMPLFRPRCTFREPEIPASRTKIPGTGDAGRFASLAFEARAALGRPIPRGGRGQGLVRLDYPEGDRGASTSVARRMGLTKSADRLSIQAQLLLPFPGGR